ncbi:MAG: hypothetical protein J7M11_05950 [Elusimicrobia bacterium]|nr:hypothetical protein [Elusimicrobiota bacterium]
MNILNLVLFLLIVPYTQIFVLSPLSPRGFADMSPSLIIASLVLFSSKIPASFSYVYAFLLGLSVSVIYGHPLAFDSISFLIIVFSVKKFSENFDMSGFGGQFALGFAASIFNFIFLLLFSRLIGISVPGFSGAFPQAVGTGILLVFLFNFVLKGRKQMR